MHSRHPVMRLFTVCSLVLMVLVAGCGGSPLSSESDQGGPVQLTTSNPLDTTHTFEVFVVDLPANKTIKKTNGAQAETDIGEGTLISDSGPYYYTEVKPDSDASRHYGNYTIEPGESTTRNVTGLHNDGALLVVVYDSQGNITSYVTANCDDLALTALEVEADSNGARASDACRSTSMLDIDATR